MTHPEHILRALPGCRARELAAEINGLDSALQCITDEANTSQVFGRIRDLIAERRAELSALCASALADADEFLRDCRHG